MPSRFLPAPGAWTVLALLSISLATILEVPFRAYISDTQLLTVAYFAHPAHADVEDRAKVAHAVVQDVAWAFVFPAGALVMRLAPGANAWFLHAAMQTLGLALVVVGAGNGIYVALATDQVNYYHPIIGLVLFALVFVQAAGGFLAHFLYTKDQRRNVFGHVHTWLGRAIITLGIINGGLGLLFSDDGTRGDYIAYGVVSAVIWIAFVGNAVVFDLKNIGKPASDGEELVEREAAKSEGGRRSK